MIHARKKSAISARCALLLVAVLGGVLTLRQSWAELILDQPQIAAGLLPATPFEVPDARRHRILAEDGEDPYDRPVEPDSVLAINRALPLHPSPYIWRAVQLRDSGDLGASIALLERARESSPQSSAVRRLLAEQYLLADRQDEAITELFSAAELLDSSAGLFISIMAIAGEDTRFRQRVLAATVRQPEWADTFFANLPTEAAGYTLPMAMAQQHRLSPRQRHTLVSRLVDIGEFRKARSIWAQGDPDTDASGGGAVYDPNFAGLAGGPPFGWTRHDDEYSRVTIGNGEMRADYFGGRDTRIASQIINLAPGRHEWRIPVAMDAPPRLRLAFRWRIKCSGNSEVLASASSGELENGSFRLAFIVPEEGCDMQRLELDGIAQRGTGRATAIFDAIEMRGGRS